ncbi:MetQ/NlpA family ABC transporter substrate-binding protein [Effusibacillus dendaii]|uniref:Lipoprotein n=1 Tax=Effusibacillus dendaii TaxID=2743772 RepID=A0A7I8DCY9_9BACL|nr:MetQ/NlpA family ABC transporter substrate-binding protein [Effusibacillus dendaii]BCJ87964.1 TonB-dependent receptor [Effusibacillus dendaii]
MKKWLVPALSLTLAFSLAGCGKKEAAAPVQGADKKEVTVKVGATAVPHAEILKSIKDKLKEQGVNLEIKEFSDYVQPNVQLQEKQLDANFFQHEPYLNDFNKKNKADLVKVIGVHVEPFGVYSKKIKNLNELKEGAKVAIPNDATNGGRALLLLEKKGLIKLKENAGITATVKDITDNPKKLEFKQLEAPMLPRALDDVDIALINTNYALEAKLNPTKDSLAIEGSDSPYVNILVARPDNKDSEGIQKLAKALNSPEVKKFIQEKYNGAVVPAF